MPLAVFRRKIFLLIFILQFKTISRLYFKMDEELIKLFSFHLSFAKREKIESW